MAWAWERTDLRFQEVRLEDDPDDVLTSGSKGRGWWTYWPPLPRGEVDEITGKSKPIASKRSRGRTDKKENQIFFIYKEIQNKAVAKSYMTNGHLIYGEMFAHFLIY